MSGVILIIAVLVAFPILTCIGMAVIAAVLGVILNHDGEKRFEGSELLDINV